MEVEFTSGALSFSSVIKKVKADHQFYAGLMNAGTRSNIATEEVVKAAMELTSNQGTKSNPREVQEQLTKSTFDCQLFQPVMDVIWSRLKDSKKKNWRHGLRALALLSHLMQRGSDRVITHAMLRANQDLVEELAAFEGVDKDSTEKVQAYAGKCLTMLRNIFHLRELRSYAKVTEITNYRFNPEDKDRPANMTDSKSPNNDESSPWTTTHATSDILGLESSGADLNSSLKLPSLSSATTASGADSCSNQCVEPNERHLEFFQTYRSRSLFEESAPTIPEFHELHQRYQALFFHKGVQGKAETAGLNSDVVMGLPVPSNPSAPASWNDNHTPISRPPAPPQSTPTQQISRTAESHGLNKSVFTPTASQPPTFSGMDVLAATSDQSKTDRIQAGATVPVATDTQDLMDFFCSTNQN